MKYFYSHIIELEEVLVELDSIDLNEKQRMHLSALIDSSLHHLILDAVLNELHEKDKEKFLELLYKGEHDKIWEHLNGKVDNIEEKIKLVADDLKKQLRKDIKEAKEKK